MESRNITRRTLKNQIWKKHLSKTKINIEQNDTAEEQEENGEHIVKDEITQEEIT